MNALFELLGKRYTKDTFDGIVKMGTNLDDYTITTKKDSCGRETINVVPNWQATATKEWFKRIKFAKIEYNDITSVLPSNRTEEDEQDFYQTLASIDYDNGWGTQEFFGIIAYNDGSWLDRGEYDGSEWWESHHYPREEDYIK